MQSEDHLVNVILFESLVIAEYSFENGILRMNVVQGCNEVVEEFEVFQSIVDYFSDFVLVRLLLYWREGLEILLFC